MGASSLIVDTGTVSPDGSSADIADGSLAVKICLIALAPGQAWRGSQTRVAIP